MSYSSINNLIEKWAFDIDVLTKYSEDKYIESSLELLGFSSLEESVWELEETFLNRYSLRFPGSVVIYGDFLKTGGIAESKYHPVFESCKIRMILRGFFKDYVKTISVGDAIPLVPADLKIVRSFERTNSLEKSDSLSSQGSFISSPSDLKSE